MRLFLAIALLCVGEGALCGPAWSAGKRKNKVETAPASAANRETSGADTTPGAEEKESVPAEGKKAKVLTFGALDVEGKMRTPQLLFFLNRVKAELDSTTELRRSFMKELNATAKEKGL